ncbi:MAG: sulfurtransferase [Nitrososphaerota archaeon]|jgi:thiosulfate/3-mercaptopyruvate sulfurtransferase|nr:sulfurtransferase [Nitrososphaerota archaeon]MDG6953152.1 sulfurtransferase [Nitrososphaerota archaeon]MDG6956503.1 sulfurtransferase [Nitrososphaerota archaeon]MDG6957301.1 sulfurtransferase [Nitrososphaerota archaeon]MDG6960079.1 sulfurtransferase [Nitrososphaerota archaeon]
MDESYSHPEVLVSTQWVSEHLHDPKVRVAEVDYDPAANYTQGHVPGAVLFDWKKDMNDPLNRNILSKEQMGELLQRNGVSNDTILVLYGDFNNWFAAYAFWDLKYYSVENVKLMDGGRKKWLLEDRPIAKDVPSYPSSKFSVAEPDVKIRAYREDVRAAVGGPGRVLVDVRGPKEFSGEITAPPEYPNEAAQRGGHIPGAKNIPWGMAVNDSDGTFKPRRELEALYASKGVTSDKQVITYCRIGERSSHSWFVLKYLLGYPEVRNYDGSWTEWGNSILYPIEK